MHANMRHFQTTTYTLLEPALNPGVLVIVKRRSSPEEPSGQEERETESTAETIYRFLQACTTVKERQLLVELLQEDLAQAWNARS